MTKSVLFAGVLGGLLGGFGGYALLRTLPSATKSGTGGEKSAPSETRQRADELVTKLRTGQEEEFFNMLRTGFIDPLNDEQFGRLRQGVIEWRQKFAQEYGAPGDFEFGRETVLSPSLVRVAYVVKHAHGAVVCIVIFYKPANDWRILAFSFKPLETAFDMLR
ncbi:hypothetical protein VT84_04640 [Gemmata sp. SH-PL17]|uniref:hypothetical protein n=1 Tax=Gemmata sp. SH-PL17 TaxID=1630693 RepID=UPI00078EB380|nr:hypothetical protein [Gemmata sp. SH-PL17]AMV23676.1 hypothetical protein VT84_04640 [Gemmata sp. SH-PL17]